MPLSPLQIRPSRAQDRRGFTLIEVLVVIGILIVIIGLALPAILYAKKVGQITRTKADLALIGTALEAYKHDFGDYPRFANPLDDFNSANTPGNGSWLDYAPVSGGNTDRGARLLCFALLSPGPETSSTHTGTYATAVAGEDGANGFGFRLRRNPVGGTQGVLAGKVWGPYIDSTKFKLEYDTTNVFPNYSDAKLLDGNGNPILYYPAATGVTNITAPTQYSYVWAVDPRNDTVAATAGTVSPNTSTPLYNAFDNVQDITPSANGRLLLSVKDMQTLLNADQNYGYVAANQTAITTQPYLLWTAGADGQYGLVNGKTDDVCNFDIPGNFKK